MIITIGSQENTDIVAPTGTTIRNQSVDANPTSNPKKSDTASKQEKNPAYHPLPGIHFATYHKPSSKMIAGTDSNAEAYAACIIDSILVLNKHITILHT